MAKQANERRAPERPGRRQATIYSLVVGLVFIAVIAVAGINTLSSENTGVITPADEGWPLAEFAVPDARSELTGDANIAQDDCRVSAIPCPEAERRASACEVSVEGAIRVCDLFGRPLVLSFWFTRGADCEGAQDAFEASYLRFRDRVGFLAINVRDDRDRVRELIAERGWTHPVGLDPDGALSNLYRIGGCPTVLLAYPGGILQDVAIGDEADLDAAVRALLAASRERARARG